MLWTKSRDTLDSHWIVDTVRGLNLNIGSNQTAAEANNDAFTGANGSYTIKKTFNQVNQSTKKYVSWTFRKAEKFFDVVTYTGTGSATTISHNLGAVPAVIIVKRTDTTADWQVYHASNTASPETDYLVLNTSASTADSNTRWNDTAPTDSVFTVGTEATVNASGGTYVAYLFASDAGGFGDDGSESIIKCGSFTAVANAATIYLGWEPQWIITKRVDGISNWQIVDMMRGFTSGVNTVDAFVSADTFDSETVTSVAGPNADGFFSQVATGNYIYIAIRRPMKTPESGTEVFAIDGLASGTAPDPWFISNFVTDMTFVKQPSFASGWLLGSRLTGIKVMSTNSTAAESDQSNQNWDYMNGVYDANATDSYLSWMFKRATGFFDVVAYTGTGVARTVNHNLGVAPELMIIKSRSAVSNWRTYNATNGNTKYMNLQDTDAAVTDSTNWNNTSPTASVFTVGTNSNVNASAGNFVAYLFATLAGVSKVGSYTGTAADLNVDCGFSAGARFILIKRTDSTGDWYVYDSARGITSGNDPYLLLNSAAAEVTGTDYVDPLNAGFTVTSSAPAGLNASGGNYIFLAIA